MIVLKMFITKIWLLSASMMLLFNITSSQTGKIEYIINSDLAFDNNTNIISLYFNSIESYAYNSTISEKSTIEDSGKNNLIVKSGDKDGFPTYKNISRVVSQQKHNIVSAKYPCIIEDTLPKINWILKNEFKTISGFKSQSATCLMGGRTYDVWFTTQIPVSHGPYRLYGLPGLILEAKSTDGKINVKFKSLELGNEYSEKILPLSKKFKYELLNYSDYLQKKKKIEKKLAIDFKAAGVNWTPLGTNIDWQVEKNYF